MKQKMKRWAAYILSFCMMFGMMQSVSFRDVFAAAADGEIDESQEENRMVQTVRYLTDTETASTSSQSYLASYSDRLTDFIAGTESMKWSVEFKTSDASKLQGLLFLENNDAYCAFYLKEGKLCFEIRGGTLVSGSAAYGDDTYHKAELEIQKGGDLILRMDNTEVARSANPSLLKDLTWQPTAFTVGGSKDYNSPNGWKFTGSMKNVVLEKSYIVEQEPVWQGTNLSDAAIDIKDGIDLQNGALSMTYRLKKASGDKTVLMTFGSDGEIYVDPAGGKVGVSIGSDKLEWAAGTALETTKWHNVALVKSGSLFEIYVDGSSVDSGEYSGTLDFSTIRKGENVYCSQAALYDSAISGDQAASLHENTNLTAYPDQTPKLEGYYKGPNRDIFNAGFDGSKAYRIPAITTSKKTGTVIAAIDKRWYTDADTGVNDTVIRRSEDNGQTWGPVIPVIDMPDADAYTIDPEIAVDNDPESEHYGRFYILVDLNSYGTSLWGAVNGTGYTEVDGKQYQILNDDAGNTYTIREGGIVYDSGNNPTEYQVEIEAEAPYREQGSLYKNGTKIGSIYKNAELRMVDTVYMMMTYSDDDGKTWSRPRDITPEIKADWMSFFGVGPGAGVQLRNGEHKGRLIFTMYCIKNGASASNFSSYNVYSDDHGATWHRGGSPNDNQTGGPQNSTRELNESCIVELDNGHLIQFMKNGTANVAMAVSKDGGETWGEVTYAQGINEVYCEMAVLHYGDLYDPKDGQTKEAIIFANPSGPGRTHGKVRIAFVNDDDTLDWAYEKLIEEKGFLYNSLTLMNDGNIGIIYENNKAGITSAAFTSFSAQYIMDENAYENTPQPSGLSVDILDAAGKETEALRAGNELRIKITFDDNVFAAGSVTSNIQIGDEVKEAALIGNATENTLEFGYTIQPEDIGDITVLAEVNVKEGGAAETIYNVPLTDKPFVTKTVSLGRVQAEGFAQLPTEGMSVTAGSEHGGTNEGPASHVLNDNRGQYWHTKWPSDNAPAGRSKHWITLNLGGTYLVSGLKYLPRANADNGTITKYQIEVSTDGVNFYPYAQGSWALTADEKIVSFEYGPVLAAHVRLRSLESTGNVSSAAAIRIIGSSRTEGAVDRAGLVQELIKYSENKEQLAAAYPQFAQALEAAKETAVDASATQTQIDRALETLTAAAGSSLKELDNDLSAEITAAEEKNTDDYTITSWSAYQAAVTAAEALGEDASQEERLNAYLTLKKAAANLILKDAAMSAGKETAERKAEEAIAKLDALVREKNGVISAGDTLPLKLEDGTELTWSVNSESVRIDAYGNVIVSEDLKTDSDIEFTVAVFYSKGMSATKSVTVKVRALTQKQYTVAFNTNGGAPVPNEQKVTSGQTASKPVDPSRPDYVFEGWYLENSAAPYDFNTPVTQNITLVAKWKADGPNWSLLTKDLTVTVGKFKYRVIDPDKKTAAVTGSTGKSAKSLTIGDTVSIKGTSCTIVQIDSSAFKNYKKLKKVTIGANVATIEKNAFSGCKKLKTITLKGAALKTVKSGAFKNTAKNLTVKAAKVKKTQRGKLQKTMRKGGNKKLKVK